MNNKGFKDVQLFIKKHKFIYAGVILTLAIMFNYNYITHFDYNMPEHKKIISFIGCIMANITFSFGYLYPIYLYIYKKNKFLLED